jgi:arginyl-tRNA synthetase
MDTLSGYLQDILGVRVSPTKSAGRGDYQWNDAFRVAKEQGSTPREVAAAHAASFLRDTTCLSRATVAGAGFVNLTLDDAWLAARTRQVACDPHLGVPQDGGTVVVIDFSSPNVAKRMHVGHLRSTVIGAAIDRLLRACGDVVVSDNHIGDWGTQFGKLVVAWEKWRDEAAFAADPVGEMERLYVRFGEEAEKDPGLEDAARAATVLLQDGDMETTLLWRSFVEASRAEYQKVYDRLGVQFDVTLGESTYESTLDDLVDGLLASGKAVVSEGAVVVPVGDGVPPLLIRKSDGASLYGTTDLATIRFRVDTWAPHTIVYVTDVRQSLHFQQVFSAARSALGVDEWTELVHVGFGMMRLPEADDGVVMSSRKGNAVPLMKLLDEAHARARAVVEGRADLTPSEKRTVAEAVGVSAVVYADLSRAPATDVTFEWDRVLSLEGNTAPYLLYALARCYGIIGKAGPARPADFVIRTPEERALALTICRYGDAVEAAASTYRPSVLAEYLYGLACDFSQFHGACRVIGEDGAVDASRLGLVEVTAAVLTAGFRILGLRPITKM